MTANITVIGTVATEPKLLKFENGGTKTTFRLAESERWLDRSSGEWVEGATSWYTINASRGLAGNAANSLKKGDRVILTGKMRHRKWETADGRTGYNAEVDVEGLGHDLRFGVSNFVKGTYGNAKAVGGAENAAPEVKSAQISVSGWHAPDAAQSIQSANGQSQANGWHVVEAKEPVAVAEKTESGAEVSS